MSKWMSIGFDPDQMDPATEPATRAAISGAAAPGEFGAVSDLKVSSKHRIAGAFRHLIARRTPAMRAS
jgi:hypothetical protein